MMDNKKSILFNHIEASLRYGSARLSKNVRILLWINAVVCGACAITILLIGLVFKELMIAIGGTAFSLAPLSVSVVFFVIFYKRKTKIRLWIKDAVLIKARCSLLGKEPEEETSELMRFFEVASATKGNPIRYPNPRIILNFKYNGKTLRLMSGKQGYSDGEMVTGRDPIFKKYIGRKIDILYSPKYDQVLLLKF